MKLTRITILLSILASIACLISCEDETPTIGSGIASSEVKISVDTFYFDLQATPVRLQEFDAKTGNLMIGNISVPSYGSLNCSFVTRLMCAPSLQIPDSLLLPERVDSCKLIMAAQKEDITGDSLAPQKLSVYMLSKQLPSDIDNNFDPEGYYDSSKPLGSLSYTVSNISAKDSVLFNNTYVQLDVDLPVELGQEIFEKYKNDPSIFRWPQTLAEKFIPGLYFKSTFGKGCIANINEIYLVVFYHSKEVKTTINDKDTVTALTNVPYNAIPFSVSPEVLSSNNIRYIPSEEIDNVNAKALSTGECILTTPGGYITSFNFPIQPILDTYKANNVNLSTVNDLLLYIPATPFNSESGLSVAQNVLLIKSSEYESFFNKNKIPDNKIAFTGSYDSEKSRYVFSSLRQYFVDLLKKDTITAEDVEFVLVPVEITTETNNNGYYGTSSTYVTKCSPYIIKPTMTLLKTGEAMLTFSFSSQIID